MRRFGPNFPRLFTAAILEELSFSLLIHLPGYFSRLGASEGLIGLLYAGGAILSLALRPLFGRILDLTHRRTVILVAAITNAVVLAALITADAWGPFLWALFLVQRVTQLALFTAMLTYSADSIPIERRTQGLAIYGLSGLIPIAVGGYAGDEVIAAFGFDGLFTTAATVSFLSWLVVWTLPVLPVRGRQPRRSFWAALAQPSLLPLWLATLLFAVGMESIFTFARTFVEERGVGTAGLFLATYGVTAAVTRIIGGQVYDRISHRALITVSIGSYGVGMSALASAEAVPMMVVGAMLCGTAHGAAFPLLSSEVVNRARVSERGSALGTFTSIFDFALLAGAPAVGFLIDGFGYLFAFSAAGIALVVGSIAYRVWDRRLDPTTLVAEEAVD